MNPHNIASTDELSGWFAGRTPADWSELRAVGYLKGTPVDPTGTPYLLEAGVVVMDRKSPLAPLPTTPR